MKFSTNLLGGTFLAAILLPINISMLRRLKIKLRSGYIIAFLFLLISYFLIFQLTWKMNKETTRVAHSSIILQELSTFYSVISTAEGGMRNYIMSHQLQQLKPFHDARRKWPTIYMRLRTLIGPDEQQVVLLDTLQALTHKYLLQLDSSRIVYQRAKEQMTKELHALNFKAIPVMDSIRLFINKMETLEKSLMDHKKSKLSGFFSGANVITLISLLTAVLAITYSVITYNQENKAKRRANQQVTAYGKELEISVSELKNMNAELNKLRSHEKYAATGRIARTIAHEVRNPLTNIILATEELQDTLEQYPNSSMLLTMISRNTVRINQLVSDLLNATKFLQLSIEKVNINDLLDASLEMAHDRIRLHNIRVEKKYSDEVCGVMVDPEKIKIAFLNIIINAIEAMEKNKGVLQIRTERSDKKCIVEIRDNGSGMDDDTLQNLFEPYFSSKVKGNGLGLTNSQNIILNHKGTIHVTSQPGEGSSFVISLELY